jgi:hypothetical protein
MRFGRRPWAVLEFVGFQRIIRRCDRMIDSFL